MAIHNNYRIDADPLRVPAPAAMTTGRDDGFATALEQASTPRPEIAPAPAPEPVTDVDDELAAANGALDCAAERAREPVASDPAPAALGTAAGSAPGTLPDQAASIETTGEGESGKQKTAGKGTDSPRPIAAGARSEPLLAELAELAERGLRERAQAVPAPTVNGIGSTAPGGGRSAGDPLVRALDGGPAKAADAARAATVKPGYRTSATATAQMIDQARESVFKQIMLKIADGGGEMRIRLDPPELGELDLRMVVEHGNRLSLSIAAERPELAALIQQHVDELASTLAGVGLQLEHADVSARDASRGNAADLAHGFDGRQGGDEPSEDIHRPTSGGYIRADGLDFWV
ncbi:MAG: flagellar hook-length control protein FliK [Planctomycetes bacterium]|nr:flagellar hook-length control protein FliK [Planctomycetota bacterium]